MILKLVIILSFSAFKNTEALQEVDQYFSRLELRELEYFKDFVCGFTTNSVDSAKFDPYFCVEDKYCNETEFVNITVPLTPCDARDHSYLKDKCCYMGHITNGTHHIFTSNKKFWGVRQPINNSIEDYGQVLYQMYFGKKKQEIMDSNLLCGLKPTFHTSKTGEKDVRYIPFLCRDKPCNQDLPLKVSEWFSFNFLIPQNFTSGDMFCSGKSGPGYCCHAIAFFDENSASTYINEFEFFEIKSMSKYQNAAVGFKSSFQCEQYSRLHCEGSYDRCSLRILDRDTAVPGEFPHQALLGIQGSSFRHFHCSGTLVSRYFILSTFLCKYHDRFPTSVALLGEYDTLDRLEFGEREYLTYLDKVYVEPDFANQNLPSSHTIPRQMKMLLFKMWRQVKFHYWVKPACINWKTFFKDGPDGTQNNTLTAVFPKETFFTGFGTTVTGGRKNRTLKRIFIEPSSCDKNPADCIACKNSFFKQVTETTDPRRPNWIPENQFCHVIKSSSDKKQPCEFDLGGSAVLTVSDENLNMTPYCQWRVFGVNVDPRIDCSNLKPSLFRIIGGQLLAWLEDVIWLDDFFLPMFDMRWPSCYDTYEYEFFHTLIHLQESYWEFFKNDPL